MAAVWMRHPSLPAGQLIEVPESAVAHHQAAGWELTGAPVPKAKLPVRPVPGGGSADRGEDAAEDPASTEAVTRPKRTRKAPALPTTEET